jgi:hypothetical protein
LVNAHSAVIFGPVKAEEILRRLFLFPCYFSSAKKKEDNGHAALGEHGAICL